VPALLRVGGPATALACLVLIIWVDRPLALWLHGLRDGKAADAALLVSDIGLGLWWYLLAIGGWAAFGVLAFLAPYGDIAARRRRHARSFRFMTLVLAATTLANWTAKMLFGRLRPRFLFREDAYGFDPLRIDIGNLSFPSGHAQTMATAMLAIGVLFPRIRIPALVLAVVVALTRMPVGAHFASDVVAGFWLGAMVFWVVRTRVERRGGPIAPVALA
jgi:membrane-associated phospholipid phosphatase